MTEETKKPMNKSNAGKKPDLLMKILAGAFILSALVTAFFAFRLAREMISTTDIFQLGGLAIEEPSVDPAEGEQDAAAEENINTGSLAVENAEKIDFTNRINFLLMGLDYRDWEADKGGPARSDTMIVFTIDPVGKTAAMLSVPRDLWVNVPGYGQNKINTAYFLGEANRLPGGGPELAARTVEEFLGIEIHYWAQVDFTAFVQFIDYIGGLKLDITEPITLEMIGTERKEYLTPGRVTLPGAMALAYARNRSEGDGDFSRAQRQQQVIMAIRYQLVRRDVQKMILGNPKGIWDIFSENIQTNIPFTDAFNLGTLAMQINPEQIGQYVISPPDYVTHAYSPDGLTILKPITQNIRILRDEIFTPSGIVGPGAIGADPNVLMQSEAATVGIFNGSAVSGLAGATETYLTGLNVNVTEVGNGDYVPSTSIYDFSGKPYTVQYLVEILGIQNTRIFNSYDPTSTIDVSVILGNDWSVPQE